jgi:chromosomal replication initiator protein
LPDPEDTWSEIHDQLRDAVTDSTYNLWLEPLSFVGVDGDVLLVGAPDEIRSWVSERFARVLQACAAAVLGPQTTIAIVPAEDDEREHPGDSGGGAGRRRGHGPGDDAAGRGGDGRRGDRRGEGSLREGGRGRGGRGGDRRTGDRRGGPTRARGEARTGREGRRAGRDDASAYALPGASFVDAFNPKYTFEQFVIGEGNRLAHAAALAVSELPGQAYNPLFIYGPPGNGKTHLLHAIGNYLTAFGGGLGVQYTTAEAFTNRFVDALQGKAMEGFKASYRHNDVLLIDDIQFLESKARIEEEFFHTFNALYETGSQLVLTSDRPPRDLQALEDRLRERFESGLVTDIVPPDLPTRLTILRKRAHHDRIPGVGEDVLHLIAERISGNIRALEGALIRVVAFHSLTRRDLDIALADEVLTGLYPGSRPPRRTVTDIQRATCEAFGLSLDELLSPSRAANVAWPRMVAMYLSRELTDATLPAIGREFGGRNHTTVMHAHRRTTERISADADAYEVVADITRRLQAP